MIDKDFAIGTYEINLLADNERRNVFNDLYFISEYIDTAINYNNDYLLKGLPEHKIISKISACHYDDYEFFVSNHLKCLNRSFIDIMLIHSNRGNWIPLAKKLFTDKRFLHIGVSNFNIEDIKKYKEVIGKYPEYNELEINIHYTDIETIDFCKQNNIKIIAYGILGGKYEAMRNISLYSLPYLISYAANYSDIIILKADSQYQSEQFKNVVNNYVIDITIDYKVNNTHKSIEPMVYTVPYIEKRFKGELTYYNCCGENNGNLFKFKEELKLDLNKFEMLGDYLTYIRYKYRQNYNCGFFDNIYDYDFLIGDDDNYYVVNLVDKNNHLTKIISDDTKVHIYKYKRI